MKAKERYEKDTHKIHATEISNGITILFGHGRPMAYQEECSTSVCGLNLEALLV